jgi:hypothetical protein
MASTSVMPAFHWYLLTLFAPIGLHISVFTHISMAVAAPPGVVFGVFAHFKLRMLIVDPLKGD